MNKSRTRQNELYGSEFSRDHSRFGWTSLFIWLAIGLTLEILLGFKVSAYILDPIRREFWKLSHFHGALLGFLNLIYIRWARNESLSKAQQKWASRSLMVGSLLMPLGFFLGGLIHFEGDPGVGIFLVPVGAMFILLTIGLQAFAAWLKAH
jgi:hypothetical protein